MNYSDSELVIDPEIRSRLTELRPAARDSSIKRRVSLSVSLYKGKDHFAKPGDDLAVAQRERRLQRNFHGYSTRAECDMLGFGVSSSPFKCGVELSPP